MPTHTTPSGVPRALIEKHPGGEERTWRAQVPLRSSRPPAPSRAARRGRPRRPARPAVPPRRSWVGTQLPLEGAAEPGCRGLVEEGEHHRVDAGRAGGVLADRRRHRGGRGLQIDPADAGAEGRQGHAAEPFGGGQAQRRRGGAAHRLDGGRPAGRHRRGVQDRLDAPAGEPTRAGPHRVPHRPGCLGDRLPLDLVPGRPPDRSGHAGAEPALVVGGVDNRVDRQRGDVALPHPDVGRPAAGQAAPRRAKLAYPLPPAVGSPCRTRRSGYLARPMGQTNRRSSITAHGTPDRRMAATRSLKARAAGWVAGMRERHRWLDVAARGYGRYQRTEGSVSAVHVAYSAFFSIFPLLFAAVGIFGLVLRNDTELRDRILAQAAANLPGPLHELVKQRARAVGWLLSIGLLLGVSVVAAGALGGASGAILEALGVTGGPARASSFLVTLLVSFAVDVALFTLTFVLLPSRALRARQVLPGAAICAVWWGVLKYVGAFYVGRIIQNAGEVFGQLAIVVGLLVFINLAAQLLMLTASVQAEVLLGPVEAAAPTVGLVAAARGDPPPPAGSAPPSRRVGRLAAAGAALAWLALRGRRRRRR